MTMLVLNADDVRALLPMAECISLMRDAFRAEAEGRARQPLRSMVRALDDAGGLAWMPGAIAGPDWLGVKLISVFPGNSRTGQPTHQGVVMLMDAKNGAPKAILDAREITAIRTAAATAAATDVLAPREAKSLAVFGSGEQAHAHIAALRCVRPFTELRIWARNAEKAAHLAREYEREMAVHVEASAQNAAKADVLCLTTAAPDPYFKGEWLRPGHHINVVGSSVPTTSEIDVETLVRPRLFVDFKESTLALGGDFKRAMETGRVSPSCINGTIGDVLIGRATGRRNDQEMTLFKSLGMVAQDLFAAAHVLSRAIEQGRGTDVEF